MEQLSYEKTQTSKYDESLKTAFMDRYYWIPILSQFGIMVKFKHRKMTIFNPSERSRLNTNNGRYQDYNSIINMGFDLYITIDGYEMPFPLIIKWFEDSTIWLKDTKDGIGSLYDNAIILVLNKNRMKKSLDELHYCILNFNEIKKRGWKFKNFHYEKAKNRLELVDKKGRRINPEKLYHTPINGGHNLFKELPNIHKALEIEYKKMYKLYKNEKHEN